ncbi:endonuclease 4-like isoform X2 [Lycium ferocissimum]|uniref:endonuclease 4-like isoform X2 n=1 Tax=Lycium ferocissimum TaxID=112874 RepID=UPI0028156049|nr:endonuclease 4-like isoform X2 [Lycium ferocissimum]
MGGFELKWFVRVVVVLMMVPNILGWGKDGHYVICKIAEEYLTADALAAVKALLPEQAEGDLAAVCSWADHVRFHYHWSSPLHYVDTPDFFCNYKYCRDCHDGYGRMDRCVTGAIYNYSMQLSQGYYDLNSEKYNLTEALMFLSHFVGDVHQPLHCGFIGDLGGNTIIVRWYRRKTNLHHHEWSDDVPSWENCTKMVCPDPYASESIRLACKFAYRNATPGSTLTDDYFLSRLPVVEKRLAQSGVRLAEVLNRIFTKKPSVAAQ